MAVSASQRDGAASSSEMFIGNALTPVPHAGMLHADDRRKPTNVSLYLCPTSLDEALDALSDRPMTVLAGGTDVYPARVGRPFDEDVLDISRVRGLRGIEDRGDHWLIGATTTWTDVLKADLPPLFDGLKLAAREVGGVQIQNAGTIAGNLCNASPAADGVPALMSLDAEVEISGKDGVVTAGLADFITGNRQTTLRADQLVTGVRVPKPAADWVRGHFLKLGARRYLVISIVMAAGVIEVEDETVCHARIAVGSCSAVAQRLKDLEAALIGCHVDGDLGHAVTDEHLAGLAPIDDVRASADYRRHAALTLVRRLLNDLGATA